MKNLSIVLLLIFSFYHSSYAHYKLFPGYYITSGGDTIRCEFNFNDWSITPKTVSAQVNGNALTFSPSDIKGFGIDNFGDYITSTVTYHKGGISGYDFPQEYSEDTVTNRQFLKIVVGGKYSLYSLNLSERPYYFIREESGPVRELIYRKRLKNMKIDEDQQFRTTIFELFSKEMISYENMGAINKVNYSGQKIGALIEKLNEKYSGPKVKVKLRPHVGFDIYGGVTQTSFPSKFSSVFASNFSFGADISPSFGVNVMYYFPTHFQSLAVGLSLGYTGYKLGSSASGVYTRMPSPNYNDTTVYHETVYGENSMLMANLYLTYFVNKFSKVRIYFKAGGNGLASLKGDNDIFSNYTDTVRGLRNGNLPTYQTQGGTQLLAQQFGMVYNANIGAGVMSGRHKIELMYYTPVSLSFEPTFKIQMIALHYYFTVVK